MKPQVGDEGRCTAFRQNDLDDLDLLDQVCVVANISAVSLDRSVLRFFLFLIFGLDLTYLCTDNHITVRMSKENRPG